MKGQPITAHTRYFATLNSTLTACICKTLSGVFAQQILYRFGRDFENVV